MYLPKHFVEADIDVLHKLIDEIGAATLITCVDGELTANQVPLLLDRENNCLLGHLARPNSQLQALAAGNEVLANFLGPQAYISPSWYSDQGLVPTWNFVSVQVRGIVQLLDEPAAVLEIIEKLTQREESALADPWTADKVQADKLERMLKVIVGFRLEITDIKGKLKLSQNRSAQDQASAVAALRARAPSASLADFMERSQGPG